MINFAYHLARAEGKVARDLYRVTLPLIVRHHVNPPAEIPIDVFSYSGESALAEQIASIRSFLTFAGRPRTFTVVSDGSYTARSRELLNRIDSVVEVEELPEPPGDLPEKLRSYLATDPMGKQLALIMSLPRNGPALYVDSDVRFFSNAGDLSRLSKVSPSPAFYLTDNGSFFDERLLSDSSEKQSPVNGGFLLLFQKLDWSLGLDRLRHLEGGPAFHTGQTVIHLTMHANGAQQLDPDKYVLKLDDQFIYRDLYAADSVAMRHYVNPVRHKFWTHFAR